MRSYSSQSPFAIQPTFRPHPLVSVHDSVWVPDWLLSDSASIWLKALLVVAPTVRVNVAEWLPEAADPVTVME
jgi:hypothetical protein